MWNLGRRDLLGDLFDSEGGCGQAECLLASSILCCRGGMQGQCARQLKKAKVYHCSKMLLAERGGFEPPVDFKPYDGLANRCFRPLSHLSRFRSAWCDTIEMATTTHAPVAQLDRAFASGAKGRGSNPLGRTT